MNFIILGGYGNIGKVVAQDLFHFNPQARISIAGRDGKKARDFAQLFKNPRVKAIKVNIANVNSLARVIKNHDICINAAQYYFNLQIMKACIKANVHYLDLGGLFHMTRKQLLLHSNFKEIKKTAILGCGSTPGITNVLAGYASQFFDTIKNIEISFADADLSRAEKFVLPYSFQTLIDEFSLNPYILKKGKLIPVPPLSGEKILSFQFPKPFDQQKGFYTLHSELATFPWFFKNKGLKECSFRATFSYDFSNTLISLIELGLTSKATISLQGNEIPILDITAEIMNQWLPHPHQNIHDKEIVRVDLRGEKNGKKKRVIMEARTNSKRDIPAGTYDTGVPASIIASMITNHEIIEHGVLAPEQYVPPISFFKELERRGISIIKDRMKINFSDS